MRWFTIFLLGFLAGLPAAALGDTASAWQAYVKGNHKTAAAELRALAEAGDAAAQNALGTVYSDGLAWPRDYKLAAAWYEKAAVQGYPPAQFNLGFLLFNGAGDTAAGEAGALPRDPVAAARWLGAAARAGDPMAALLLARLYGRGFGPEPDATARAAAALHWSLQAAEQGLAGGQFQAGVLLGNRRHDARAWVEAYKWLLLAARSGHPGARDNLEILGKRLNHKEIGDAETAAADWSPPKAATKAAATRKP